MENDGPPKDGCCTSVPTCPERAGGQPENRARHVAAVGETATDWARRHRGVSSGAVSRGVQTGQEQADDCDAVQLCAQTLCLEEMMQTPIARGAIFYGNPRRRLEIVFTPELRARTEELAATMHRLYRNRETPPAQPGPYCKVARWFMCVFPKPPNITTAPRAGWSAKCVRSQQEV